MRSNKEQYHVNEYDIHSYLGTVKKRSYDGCIGINAVQKLGTNLYQSIRKSLFCGTMVHYRKFGQTSTLEDKTAKSGIIYKTKGGAETVRVFGKSMPLKPIRARDFWMQEAMAHDIRYCRIVRKPYKAGYRYFLQIVMDGPAPEKITGEKGRAGLDLGTSTMAFDGEGFQSFMLLAPDVKKHEAAVRRASVVYERRRHMANPENYNPDGTVRRDTASFHKTWKHTKGMDEAVMRLKYAYRRKEEYVRQNHGHKTNLAVSMSGIIIKEPMDYRGLARRAKETSRADMESAVKKKDGSTIMVRKYKRKKRFGTSVGRYSPRCFYPAAEGKGSEIRDACAGC